MQMHPGLTMPCHIPQCSAAGKYFLILSPQSALAERHRGVVPMAGLALTSGTCAELCREARGGGALHDLSGNGAGMDALVADVAARSVPGGVPPGGFLISAEVDAFLMEECQLERSTISSLARLGVRTAEHLAAAPAEFLTQAGFTPMDLIFFEKKRPSLPHSNSRLPARGSQSPATSRTAEVLAIQPNSQSGSAVGSPQRLPTHGGPGNGNGQWSDWGSPTRATRSRAASPPPMSRVPPLPPTLDSPGGAHPHSPYAAAAPSLAQTSAPEAPQPPSPLALPPLTSSVVSLPSFSLSDSPPKAARSPGGARPKPSAANKPVLSFPETGSPNATALPPLPGPPAGTSRAGKQAPTDGRTGSPSPVKGTATSAAGEGSPKSILPPINGAQASATPPPPLAALAAIASPGGGDASHKLFHPVMPGPSSPHSQTANAPDRSVPAVPDTVPRAHKEAMPAATQLSRNDSTLPGISEAPMLLKPVPANPPPLDLKLLAHEERSPTPDETVVPEGKSDDVNAESAQAEPDFADGKPAEAKPGQSEAQQSKRAQSLPPLAKPVETRPARHEPPGSKPTDRAKPGEAKPDEPRADKAKAEKAGVVEPALSHAESPMAQPLGGDPAASNPGIKPRPNEAKPAGPKPREAELSKTMRAATADLPAAIETLQQSARTPPAAVLAAARLVRAACTGTALRDTPEDTWLDALRALQAVLREATAPGDGLLCETACAAVGNICANSLRLQV